MGFPIGLRCIIYVRLLGEIGSAVWPPWVNNRNCTLLQMQTQSRSIFIYSNSCDILCVSVKSLLCMWLQTFPSLFHYRIITSFYSENIGEFYLQYFFLLFTNALKRNKMAVGNYARILTSLFDIVHGYYCFSENSS